MNIKNELTKIKSYNDTININRKEIERLKKLNEDSKSLITDIINDTTIKEFINNKLQESIDKYDLNKNKEDKQELIETCTTSNSNGDRTVSTYTSINPDGKFIPAKDKWEISEVEFKEGKYRITVENIKGRKFLNPFMWEPDYYKTDWFTI